MKRKWYNIFIVKFWGCFITCFLIGIGLIFTLPSYGQNLLYNGNFEFGASGNGFVIQSPYNYITNPSGSSLAGDWTICKNPKLFNSFFDSSADHTTGTGNMLVVDGTTNGGQQRFWKAGNNGAGIIGFDTGITYTFSYWIKSVTNDPSRADIGVFFNNTKNVQRIKGNTLAPLSIDGWQQVVYTFQATNYTVNIELYNNTTTAIGNDFAIDDIQLYGPPLPLSFSFSTTNPTCPNVSDGLIVAYGVGGLPPYSFSFDGGLYTSNNTLRSLGTSSHQFSIKDSLGQIVNSPIINIISPTNNLKAQASDDSICSGKSVNLSATGAGTNGYSWTSIPNDPTLTTPTLANPVVKPIVPTKYFVSTSSTVKTELVYNGDFSLGNIGFLTDYVFRKNNVTGGQRAYGIDTIGQRFYNNFSTCGDHTSGVGNMMIIDGSINPTDRIWSQIVTVKPGTTYTFSYWVQSLTSSSPARIEARINGQLIPGSTTANPYIAPASSACGQWQQVSYTWIASSTDSSAEIALYDRNFDAIGNDFALDDISFFTNTTTCTVSDSVFVHVTTTTVANASITYANSAVCNLSNNSLQPTYTAYPTGTHFFASPTGLSIDSLNGNIKVTSSLPNTYFIKYQVTDSGCRIGSIDSFQLTIRPPVTKPTYSLISTPTCTNPTASLQVNNPLANNLQYSVDSGKTYQVNNIFNGLQPGALVTIVVKDTLAGGCISDSTQVQIPSIPPAPSAPILTNIVQPTCTVATGSFTISSPLQPNYQYSIGGAYQQADSFTNVNPNTYSVTVKDVNTGCVSSATSITINPQPKTPSIPQFVVNQPTCLNVTGSIRITSPIQSSFKYGLNGNYQLQDSFTNLIAGNYTLTILDTTSGCTTNPAFAQINTAPNPPATPIVQVTQPNCTTPTGSIIINSPTASNYLYSVGASYQTSTLFNALTPNSTYTVTVKDTTTGCISSATIVNIQNIPAAPAAPSVTVLTQPNCLTSVGSVQVNSPVGSYLQYKLINTGTTQFSTSFNNLLAGNYSIQTIDTSTGCSSTISSFSIVNTGTNPTGSINYVGSPFIANGNTYPNITSSAVITSGTFTALPSGLDLNPNTGLIILSNCKPGKYSITYNFNSGTCAGVASTNIEVLPANNGLFIPNTFTPNADGKNDVWYVYGETIMNIVTRIFNAYGQEIFISRNKQTGWDGKVNGQPQPVGVYVYSSEVVFLDGTKEKRTGTITLVR